MKERLLRTTSWVVAVSLAGISPLIAAEATAAAPPAGAGVVTKVGAYPVRYLDDGMGMTEAAHGTATTLTVDYSTAATGTHTVDWTCGVGPWEHHETTLVPDETAGGVVVYSIDTTTPSDFCTFSITGPTSQYFVRLLQLDALAISQFRNPTGPTVYPLVTPDAWRARFQTNSPAEVTTTVRNSAGKVVFRRTSGTKRLEYLGDASRVWEAKVAWNGRRTNGSELPVGRYRVKILVHSTRGSGNEVIGPIKVALKPGRRPITKRLLMAGSSGQDVAKGGCFAADQLTSAVWLNCSVTNGGSASLAQATYTFTVPRSAQLMSWKAAGGVGGDDRHAAGHISKTLTRPSATTFKIVVKVTGTRSWVSTEVWIKFTYLK